MKKKTIILSFIVMTAFYYSCSKDKVSYYSPTPSKTYPNYAQLKVGNYWIYQEFTVDTLGNATPTINYDSCYIDKDTIINGKTYYQLVKPAFDPAMGEIALLRDSLHYIIDSRGKILFSSQDSLSILDTWYCTTSYDTVSKNVRKMTAQNVLVTVQAGTFTTSDALQTYYMYPNYSNCGNIRYTHTKYAKDIGIIVETLAFYVSYPFYTERRLVRYHLN